MPVLNDILYTGLGKWFPSDKGVGGVLEVGQIVFPSGFKDPGITTALVLYPFFSRVTLQPFVGVDPLI